MSAHTPGPWRVSEMRGEHIAIRHNVRRKGAITTDLALVTARRTWMTEAEANARLIAAAPALLAALRDIYDLYDRGVLKGPNELVEQEVRAAILAIAKAEGR